MKTLALWCLGVGLAFGLVFVAVEIKVVYDLATHAACAPIGGTC